VRQAEAVACVSAVWQAALRADFGVEARLIGNGVDAQRFSPAVAPIDFEVRRQYALDSQRPLILSVGGVEARKNSLRLLEAFLRLRRHHPTARLLVVGGASLLDHARVRDEFLALLARAGLAASETGPVTLTGPVPDAHMAPLFRAANVFAFPSLTEGFGLAVLEALACGTPVVTSRIPPFTEYLNETHCRFAQPDSVSSIAAALEQALDPWIRATVRPSGIALARSMGWESCALRQEALYQSVLAHRKQGGPEYHA
jgi:glycosyltransferase-like protein